MTTHKDLRSQLAEGWGWRDRRDDHRKRGISTSKRKALSEKGLGAFEEIKAVPNGLNEESKEVMGGE